MQWKVNLRRALEANGHRITPIHRDSVKRKGVPLAQSVNTYVVVCNNCDMHFTVKTIPGFSTPIDKQIYDLECRKARNHARKELLNGN